MEVILKLLRGGILSADAKSSASVGGRRGGVDGAFGGIKPGTTSDPGDLDLGGIFVTEVV